MKKAVLIVMDSVGIGQAPDAAEYDDVGASTLPHLSAAVGGLKAPVFQSLGLGNIPGLLPQLESIAGVPPTDAPLARVGAMREVSQGKDTITGHWEIGGLVTRPGFHVFPAENSFPPELLAAFERETGRKAIGNKAASGTAILDELGDEMVRTGALICYTSADSVFQIAAHEEVVPVEELYRICGIARRLCDPLKVGRVIARPFLGADGAYKRTENRRDFAYQPPEPTILERLTAEGVPVWAVGKIEDIYAHRGVTESNHTGNNRTSAAQVDAWYEGKDGGLIFANFIDFDMLYGHRRDAEGYAKSIEWMDGWLAGFLPKMKEGDVLILTADHGNDPTFKGSDHTREYVPLVVYEKGRPGGSLGIREGFHDIAMSLAEFFGLKDRPPRGVSFL